MTGPHDASHRVEHLPLDDVQSADRNAKAHDDAGIRRSIGKFGVAELPLLDDRTGKLVAGHGRIAQLRAMRDGGDSPPAGVRLDADGGWLVPVLRGWASRSDAEANAYLVASNRLTERGGWDDQMLAEMLSEAADVDLLRFTGYDAAELAALQRSLEPDDDTGPTFGDADEQVMDDARTVVITCRDEAEQQQVLERCLELDWDATAVTR